MKNIYRILLIISAAFIAASCGSKEEGPNVSENIVAEWHLTSVSGMSTVPQVYINFAQDLSFQLYQKVGDGRYRRYDGTYTVASTLLSGKYADGQAWGSNYTVSFDGDVLVLTADNGSAEVCKYEKKALPETDKAEAILVTKSEEDGPRFL